MRKIVGIKTFHHFRMSSYSPGDVFAKEYSDSASHIQTTEGTLDSWCCHFTTWTKCWLSVVFVWLHPTVFPRWWERHCLPTATNPEVSCQQRGYSKPWPHGWQTSFTTQNMLRVLGSTLGIDGGAHFRFRRLWMAEYLYTTSSLTEGPSSSYEHSLQSTKWKET